MQNGPMAFPEFLIDSGDALQ